MDPFGEGLEASSRSEARKKQEASDLAELERLKKLSDLDALNELYETFGGDGESNDEADNASEDWSDEDHVDGGQDDYEEGGTHRGSALTGERMDEHKKRLAKEKRMAQSQAQREAAAATRKEARAAKAAQIAKEKEAAKAAAKAAKEQAAAAATKDSSQRTLMDSFNAGAGRKVNPSQSGGGSFDIDQRLSILMGGGDLDDEQQATARSLQKSSSIAALGKSVLAGLGDDSDEDDDDFDGDAIDINAALFGDVQKSRAAETIFGKISSHATENDAAPKSINPPLSSALVERLTDEPSFDYEGAKASTANKKPTILPASATATNSTKTASSVTPTKPANPNLNHGTSNFKQREAGVVATSEHIQTTGGGGGLNAQEEEADDIREENTLMAATVSAAEKSQSAASYNMGKDAPSALSHDLALMPLCMSQSHGTFYWLDAKEVGPHAMVDAGSVYLIGKLMLPSGRTYESCCIRVNGMYRSLMFRALPNSPQDAVVAEIMGQLHRQGIKQFTVKIVKRYYCFDEPDVPREKRELQQWYKVNYSASFPLFAVPQAIARPPYSGPAGTCPPPIPLPGYQHVELCIGADRSLIETFLLKRRFTFGPCFVRFNERLAPVPPTSRVSHCKHEFTVSRPKSVFVWDRPFRNSDYNAPAGQVPVYTGSFAASSSTQLNRTNSSGASPSKYSAQSSASTSTASYLTTQQVFSPPHYAPQLSGATIQLITQINSAGTQNEIFAICIAMCTNSILPDGGKRAVPTTEHVLLVRPWDSRTPLPMELASVGRSAQLRVQPFGNEKEMLQWLVDFLVAQDPDVLLGHNFVSFTLDVLLHRMQVLYITNWSALGRIRQSLMPTLQKGAGGMRDSTYNEKEACLGRLICDTYLLSREHHRSSNYKLISLARELGLKGIYTTGITQEMVEEGPPMITKELMTVAKETVHMLGRCLNLSRLTFELAYRLDMIPLTKQLCAQSGTSWSRVLIGSRSERIEFLLLHAFYAQKYVLPEKKRFNFNNSAAAGAAVKRHRDTDEGVDVDGVGGDPTAAEGTASTSSKRSAKYKGGMVLEPISGLYQDYILMLDFNSLYPSLIQEFNICFTTVNRSSNPNVEVSVPLAEDLACGACVEAGKFCMHKMVLPRVIERLVTSRREVKKRMKTEKNEDLLAQLDIRQMALKLTANSMYGCLGFEYSRFYAQPLAELVTSKGRDTLSNTVSLIPTVAPSLRVIYGDTDSVMMQTGVKDSLATVREFGQRIQAAVNKKYKKLEIGIDGVYRSILLMTKKKYAALSVDNWEGAGDQLTEVVKGLDMVRRDWCPLVRIACKDILHRILRGVASPDSVTAQQVVQLLSQQGAIVDGTGGDEDDVLQFILSYMQRVAEDVRAGQTYELKEFVICKSLTKEPESYKGDNFPHATVALRMKHRKEAVRVGDLIPYVICKERTKLPNAQKVAAVVKTEGDGSSSGAVKVEGEDGGDNAAVDVLDGVDEVTVAMGGSKLSHHAYHEDEVKREPSKHHLDVEWYLSTQIYPPVLRICQHIQGFSAAQLAEYMQLKNASQIAATAEAAAAEGGASSANTWGTFDTQYLSRFRTDRLEDCFPLAEALQIKCQTCHRISNLQPHEYVERNILPLFREKKKDSGFTGKPSAVFKAFELYSCCNCHTPFPLRYVSNTMSLFVQRKLREFYVKGGSPAEVAKIQSQISYLRALFDVPHLPGVSPDIISLHKRFALRCVDTNGALCTLEDPDGVDPVKELVERTYRRVHGLRVDTGSLFKNLDFV